MIKPLFFLLIFCLSINLPSQIKVDCIGNSITYGYGLKSPYTQSYPAKLQSLLGSSYLVQNDGVSATTMLKNGNNPYWKNGRLSQAFEFKPDIVILKLGTNDTKPENWDKHSNEFKSDYSAMIDTLSSMPSKPKIYVVLPVPVFNNPTGRSWGIRDSILKMELPIINEIASEKGISVIDCYNPFLKFPQFFNVDGVHPDSTGADTIAHIVFRAITSSTSVLVAEKSNVITFSKRKNSMFINTSLIGTSNIDIFDIRGRLHKTIQLNENELITIQTSSWTPGLYLVHIKSVSNRKSYFYNLNIIK